MSTEEFEREFDILYNNIMSNAAPSIDAYEKSVFLTKAQEDLVLAIYDGSFENSEKLIESLSTGKQQYYSYLTDDFYDMASGSALYFSRRIMKQMNYYDESF